MPLDYPPKKCFPYELPGLRKQRGGTGTYLLTFRPARGRLSACLAWPESSFRVSRTTLLSAATTVRMFSSLMTTAVRTSNSSASTASASASTYLAIACWRYYRVAGVAEIESFCGLPAVAPFLAGRRSPPSALRNTIPNQA